MCSQHAAKGLILESCEGPQASEAFILVIGPRQPVSPRPPPTSTALIGSLGWSPLLVPCSGFNDLQHPQPALALGVLCLLFRSVYVIDFVLGFAGQNTPFSTTFSSDVSCFRRQLILSKDSGHLHVIFYLHHLLGYFGGTPLVSSFVCRAATSGRHCKVLRAWRCKVHNASFSTTSPSTTTSQLKQLHGSLLGGGGGHLVLNRY
jgi:hypothetical protein